ncbi:unnamed protein product, partial [Prorocentrum cordatum]
MGSGGGGRGAGSAWSGTPNRQRVPPWKRSSSGSRPLRSSYVVCDGCSRWRYCKNITSRGDLCICGKNLACLVPDGHVFRDEDGGWLAAQPQGGTSPRISWADGWQPGGGAGGKGQGGQRQPPPHDKTVDLKAAAAAAYSKLSKDDPHRQHNEALWPELAAAKPPAEQPVVGFKAVEAAARRLDKLQKKVRSAGEQVESAQQYLAESERKLREAMEASIAAEDEFDKLKATVGKQEAPAEPAAEKPTLAALLEQFEHEPDDFHKWSEPDKEVWRAAKAKGERMAQTVKEHEEETAKHLRLLEEETAGHQEQLRQLEQARTKRLSKSGEQDPEAAEAPPGKRVPPQALRQQGQLPRLRLTAPQQLPNQKQVQQHMTKLRNAEPEWRPTSRRRERRSRRPGAPRQSSTQKGKVTTQQGSRPTASAKKARRPYHIDFFNVTTWAPQAQGYPMEINGTKDRGIIGIAEHHLRQPAQISKARAALRRNGMHSYWTKDRIAGFDEHYLHEDGSDVTVAISNLHKVRFAVAFVYLECGTGFGERNVDILCDLREKMAVWGGPWAALGDFNMTPSELNNSIWPRVLNAQVAAAEDGEARCIDFALISQGLAPYYDQLELLRTAPWKPHIGIRLKLKGRPLMLKGRAGCDLEENDMEPVPQLYYDKEVQHVIPDELWQHLQRTVVGKLMERDLLDLGQQHDHFASTLELSLCESIGIPEEERGRNTMDIQDHDPFEDEENYLEYRQEIADQENSDGYHKHVEGQQASLELSQTVRRRAAGPASHPPAGRSTMDVQDHDPFEEEEDCLQYRQETADQEDCDGYHQRIEGQQDSIGYGQTARRHAAGFGETAPGDTHCSPPLPAGTLEAEGTDHLGSQNQAPPSPEAEEQRDMGLPPPDPWNDDQHQREREDYVAMRDDLEYWAAIWMDNLVQLPTDNSNWMQICVPFLETILGGGGNNDMVRLLRRRYQQDQQQALLADLHAIAEGALVDPGTISRVAGEVKSMAKLLTKAVKKAYIHWVHDATAGSAKMAHAYTKAAERSHLEDILEHEGQVINHPQQLVDLRKEAWQRRWTRDAQKTERIQEALAKLRQAALAQENALEPISKDIIGPIIQHLKRNAGQGADWWRAPELKAMSAQGLEDFVQCLTSCEQRAAWPWQFYLVLELLLGKKQGIGGERPIGLMPMPYRIWSAARRPIVATWSKAAAGFWDTAVAGSSALRVAMHRLMRAEAATEMGFHAAGVFYDAANFYDNIGLDRLIEKATALQYPLLPLAMAVQMYLAPRAIMAHSLFSDIFEPANSMVAGCGQAVDLTRPLLYGILDAAHRHHIFAVMQQYLDDLALQVEGARRQVIDQIKHVAALVHDGFKQLAIPISVKTAVVASDKDLQAKAKQRAAKLRDLAKTDARGAAKVYSAGAYCQQAWDLPAHGTTPTEAKLVRATEAALLTGGHKAGRCTSTILLIQRGMQEAVTRAIGDQIKQFWLTVVDHPTELKRYQRGWLLLYAKLGALEPNRRWQQVKGPMAGVIAQLLGLGWIPRRLDSWISPAGDEWAYKPDDIPHFGALLHEVQQSAQQQLWQQAAGHRSGEGLQAGGDLYQLQRHLRRRRRKGQHAEAAMLETIAVAGIWTRERRRAANLNQEGDDTCARCGEAIETEEHRYYACPANAEIGHSNDTDLAKKAKDALDQRQDLHFWLRDIPPAAWAAKVDPDEDAAKAAQIFCTSEEAQAAAQSGHKVRADYVFTDGSGGAGETARDPRLRRCGWAVVAFRFDEQGRPQEVAAWYGTIRAPHTVPRAELTAMSKAIGYTTAATARGLNIVSDCKYALDALKQIQDPEDLDYRSTNYDLWLQTKQQLQNSTNTIMGHHIPSHLIEHPAELERWNGPTWWVIGNEMADKYAGWGAEHGALDPAIIAQQQIMDQITMAVQNRLLAINMAVTVEDPNKAQSIRDWLAETGKCLGKYGGHQDQHGNVRLDFKAVQIGTQVVHVSHKTQFTHGWLWCEKCGGTSYLGDHKSRIVAGVARKLARPCQPPTAAGRRVLEDMQRGKLPRGAKPAADPADEGLDEITLPGDFKLGLSNHEVIDLDGDSSEAGDPQPAPQQPPSHPHSVVHASWRLVDHMEGYAEQWMNMVDQEVWDDKDDWMEHCVPYLLAITNVGGRTDTKEQTRAVTEQELQQIKDFCGEVWRNTHRTRRGLMTRMLTLPYGARQQAARVHMDAFQNRRSNILAHSIPSSERRPLPRTAEASREWSPENLDDDDSTPDSEAPELEGEPSSQEIETMAGPDQRRDANSLMQTAVQVAVTLTKPVGPDLMKFVSEADEAGLLHPRLRHNKGEADQDPEQEVAWLERNRLEQLMQSLAGCWSQKEGEQGWPSWQAPCVPHVLRALQTGVYQRLFSYVSGTSRQRSQRRAAEEICRLAFSGRDEPPAQPAPSGGGRSTKDMADLDHVPGEENSEDCPQQPVDKQNSDDNHQQLPDVQHSIGHHLADRRGPQRGEGLGHGGPQRGEGLDRRTKGKQRIEVEVPDEPSEHDADVLTNSVVDRTSQLTERTLALGNRQTEREGEGLARGYHVNREHSEWHSRGTSPEPVGSSTEDGDSARLGAPPRGEGLGHKTAQPEKAADYDDTDLQRDLEKISGDPPQRGEGLDHKAPLRGEGLGHGNPLRGEGVDRRTKGKQRLEAEAYDVPSEHNADLLTNSVVDRTSQLTERTHTLGDRQAEREGSSISTQDGSVAQQLNQPDPGRLNEEGAAKDQQQALLADLHAIAEGALVDPGTISRVAEEVKSMAKLPTKAVKKAYIHWVHDATAGSAKMAHAYTKAAERSHLEDILEHEGQVINHPQQLVDLRKEAWQRRWTRDAQKAERIQEALAKLRQAALAQENALEPISKDIIGSIIQHLKRNAGQGAGWWRAPELKAMGAQGLEDFVQCLTSCEQRAAWPWQFYLALELLLGKKPGIGGERPIGPMPMPYRIWSAARRPIVATWSKAAAGFWDTAVAGSSALRVAMHRLMRAEAATEMGFHAAGVFYDAANFYDNIGLDQLIEKASALQYPLLPLAMAVQMYLAPRAIMAHSLFSDIFEHHIFVVMQQYLDDLALQVEGARRQVIDQIKHVAALVHDGFKQLAIPISVKTAVVASDKDLQAEVASILDSLGTPNKQPGVVRDLGVDTSLGKRLRRPTHAARQAKAKQRVAKLKDLAKTDARGAAKVCSAGAYCQQAWDLPAHGITPTEAKLVRATDAALLTAIGDQIKQFWLTVVDHPTELKRYQRGWLLLYAKLGALEPNRRWQQAAMLETIAVAGIWTRERRRAANLNQEGDDTCARCGEAIETEEHRYYACPANAEIGHSNDTDLAKKAKDALDQRQDLHLWLRDIPPAAWAAKVDPDEDAAKAAQIFCTSEEAQAAAQSGHKVRADYVFTDGSGGAGETARDPRLRRCGWAVVDTIMGHHIPSHLIEHPAELERWNGPTWWVIGNEMADKYAGWGAEHGALDPAIIAQQQIRDQITMAVQNRLLAINMAVTVEDPNKAPQRPKAKRRKPQTARDRAAQQGHDLRKLHPRWWCATCRSGPAKGQSIRDWLAETGKCLGKYGGHQDQHGNVRLDFKAVQIGTQVVHVSHKTQFTHGWLWCEKCGGTSYLGDHKSRIVAGVARKLARPCQPPTAAGRRVLEDMQRGKLPRGAKPAADPADEGLDEITLPGDFKLGLSNHEAIDLDGDSSEAGGPQPAPQQPPSHPHSVVHASWRLVDHMEGYAEQWMNMVDQEVWDDKDDWMEHCVPYLLAITNVGGRTDTQEQTRAVTEQELQQIKDFCGEVWRNTHRTRRRLMTRMLTLPYGTRQQAARVHMDAFQNRRNNILAHSIPSSERRPLPRTAEASREWSPENLDDDDSTPDSEAPELEGEPSSQEIETMAGPDQRHDANSLMQTAVQVAVTLTKPVGPDLMKFVSEADEAGLLHPRLRHNKGEADQDPEQEVAWLERNRLEQLMQSLAGCWSQKEGEQGWPSWQAACVPHVLRALQTGVYQRLFSYVSGTSRQRSQRRAAEEICRLAWLNSGEARRQIQQQDPKEAERRRATAEQILGVTEPEVRSRSPRRSTKDMADLDHVPEEENSEDCPQQPVDKQNSDDNHQQFPDVQHSIGYHLADRRGPQRGEGLGHGGPQRGEGLDRRTKGKQRIEAEVPDEPSEHDADVLTNSVVDRTPQLPERTLTMGNRQTEREGEGLARGYHVNREHSEWHSRGTSPEPVGSSTEDGDSARLGAPPRGEGLGHKTAQPEKAADYDDTDLQRDLEKIFGDPPQRGEGLDHKAPLRGEGLGHGNPLRGEGVDRRTKGKQRLEAEAYDVPSEHNADLLTNSVVDRTSQLTERTHTL